MHFQPINYCFQVNPCDGFAITTIHLKLTASVPDISESAFKELAEAAKAGCPISKVLNAKISLDIDFK